MTPKFVCFLLVVGLTVVAGCGNQVEAKDPRDAGTALSTAETEPAEEEPAGPVLADEIVTGFTRSYQPDFVPVDSWDDLANLSEVEVLGEVRRVGSGRTVGEDLNDEFAYRRGMAEVLVESVASASATVSEGDTIFIEFRVPETELSIGLQDGMRVALFLVSDRLADSGLTADETGAISGTSQIWELATAQGLIVEPSNGEGFVVPYTDEVRPNGDIEAPIESVS